MSTPDPTPTSLPAAPDWRALCQELLQPLAEYDGANPYHEHRDLITRTRAALDTPPAPPPEPRGCPTPGACSCPAGAIVPPELIRALELAEAALTDICRVRDPDGGVAFAPDCAMLALPRVSHALQTWRHHATPPAATREAEPLPKGAAEISDEELLELMPQQLRNDFAEAARCCAENVEHVMAAGGFRVLLNTSALAYARAVWDRAVLARWGGAAVPVPVSERPWEQPGWCDAEGRCWFGSERDGCIQAVWSMRMPIQRISHQRWCAPHWALPVPAAAAGEVE